MRQITRISGKLAVAVILWALIAGIAFANAQVAPLNVRIDQIKDDQFPKLEAYVTVSNAQGLPNTLLSKSDFTVSEDGKPVTDFEFATVQSTDLPLALVLAIDTSGSMGKTQYAFPLKDSVDAAKDFLSAMGANDQVALISIGDNANLMQDLTSDKSLVTQGLDSLKANGNTALYDAIVKGVDLLKNRPERKALILLTDGYDYGLHTFKYQDALNEAQRWSVPVMTIGFGSEVDKTTLQKMAQLTGGTEQILPDSTTLKQSFDEILTSLRQQYQLKFTSKLQADGQEHQIVVGVNFQSTHFETTNRFIARSGNVKVSLPGFTANQTVGGMLKFAPEVVAPALPVTKLEISIDGQPLNSVVTAPFEFGWDSTKEKPGPHVFTLKVTDSAGNVGQTDLTLNVRAPVIVKLANLTAGQDAKGVISLEAQVDALDKVSKVDFQVDGKSIQTITSAPYKVNWDTTQGPAGDHTVSVVATDVNGFQGSDKVPVKVIIQDNNGLLFIVLLVIAAALILIIPLARRQRRKPHVMDTFPNAGEGSSASSPEASKPVISQAVLLEQAGMTPGQCWNLNPEETRLGRKRDENDIPLSGLGASRHHAVIRQQAGQYTIFTLNPSNPILVNGASVQQHTLVSGDTIQLGDSIFRFETQS
jgi:VWFA-related protein